MADTSLSTLLGQTATALLSKILTVDGAGSGLDADLLDGQQGGYYLNAANLNAGTLNAARMPALTGDVTTVAGSVAAVIANGVVTLPKMADLPAGAIIGNNGGSAAAPQALTASQVKTLLALTKGDVGLGNVDNTSDLNKPLSTAVQTALGLKLDSSAYTAADVLAKVLTVDGTGSLLDADKLDGLDSTAFALTGHTHDPAQFDGTIYTSTSSASNGYHRLATIPIGTQFKNARFTIKAYTPTGTVTEATVWVNLGYYSGNTGSQRSAIMCHVSHSYDSSTQSTENAWVLQTLRISFDATSAYIDVNVNKTVVCTIETRPDTMNDWTWHTGALTYNPTVGSLRNETVTMNYGLTGNKMVATSTSGDSTFSKYGVYGETTLTNTSDKTGQWAHYATVLFDYNSGYLAGKTVNAAVRLVEMCSDNTVDPDDLDDIRVLIRATMAAHADANAFNSQVPELYLDVEGRTTLTGNDFAFLVQSTSTSTKSVRLYVKLKAANTVYGINPESRYGRSFATTGGNTTNYARLDYVAAAAMLVSLPTPAQGSVVNASMTLANGNATSLNGQTAAYYQNASNINAGTIAKAYLPALDKTDVGLANVDNTSDANKPVSTAQATAIGLKLDKLNGIATDTLKVQSAGSATLTIEADTDNVTETDVATLVFSQDGGLGQAWMGLDSTNAFYIQPRQAGAQTDSVFRKSQGGTLNVMWDAGNDGAGSGLDADLLDGQQGSYYLNTSQLGAASGVVPLGSDSKIAAIYLPSYVDDVVESADFASLPGTGETGKIYVTLNDNKTYRWSGSAYVVISASPGTTDEVFEGLVNLYFTNARAVAAITGAASTIATANLTASRALVSDGSGKVAVSAVTSTQLGYLSGVTSAIQTQLDGKASATHDHSTTLANVTTNTYASMPDGPSIAQNGTEASVPVNYGVILTLNDSSNRAGQLVIGSNSNEFYWRGFRDADGGWQAWRRMWHDGNFNPASYAPLNNAPLTGVPTAPTATAGTNTTQLATTAFVTAAVAAVSGGAYVTLTGNQNVDGIKTFEEQVLINTDTNAQAAGGPALLIYGDGNKERIELRSTNADPTYQARVGGGTIALPTATPNTATLVAMAGSGHDGSVWVNGNKARILAVATELWTPTANGNKWVFQTTPNGSTTMSDRMYIDDTGVTVLGGLSRVEKASFPSFSLYATGNGADMKRGNVYLDTSGDVVLNVTNDADNTSYGTARLKRNGVFGAGNVAITGSLAGGTSSGSPSVNDFYVKNLVQYKNDVAAPVGAIVLSAPTGVTACMHNLLIYGTNYVNGQTFAMQVAGYKSTAVSGWSNMNKTNLGRNDIQTRWAVDAAGRNCLILGDVATAWSYPHIVADGYFGYAGMTEAYAQGWTVALVTDLSAYTYVSANVTDGGSANARFNQNIGVNMDPLSGVSSAVTANNGTLGQQTGHYALCQSGIRQWQIGEETDKSFKLWSYDDAGAYANNPLTIGRNAIPTTITSAGLTFDGPMNVGGSTGAINFGSTTIRQMLNLWSTTFGIGIQNSTMYFRTGATAAATGGFAWFRAGVHAAGPWDPGAGGDELARLDGLGMFQSVTVRATGELQSTAQNALRMVNGNYGAFFRNDGVTLYILLTPSGSQYGTWNSLRPFAVDLASGAVTMANGLNVTGGNVVVTNTVNASSYYVASGAGNGLRFWADTSNAYSIFMANSTAGGAGRMAGETTSDYNMYFRMTGGTNRGFVWQNSTTNIAGLDSVGNLRVAASVTADVIVANSGGRIYVGYDSGVANSISCSAWFRSTGQTGWYNTDYGVGIYATDATYLRSYNGKAMAASDFVISSDERLKKHVRPFEYRGRLRPVMYFHKESKRIEMGFIAQEVQKLYPEVVGVFGENGYLNLSYPKMTAILSEQVNRVEDRVEELVVENQSLREENQALQHRVEDLEAKLAQVMQHLGLS